MQSLLTCSSITPSFPPCFMQNQLSKASRFPPLKHITNHNLKQLKPTSFLKPHANPKLTLFYFNLYLQLYVNAGFMPEARDLFDSMPERTLISWTILMSGYAKHGPTKEALALFKEMLSGDKTVRPDSFVYAVVLRSCGQMRELGFGKGVHGQVLKKGKAFLDGFLENSLVNMYSSCGLLEDAVLIFDGIEKPGLVAWSSMLSAYVKHGLEKEGLNVFLDMVFNGIDLDAFVFSMVIKACSNLEDLNLGIQVHGLMVKKGFGKGCCLFLDNSLMDFYAKCKDLKGLRRVFDQLYEKDLVSWNTLIMGYVHNFHYLEALRNFRVLMHEVCYCDDFTIASILKAVSSLHDKDYGRQVHGYIVRTGLVSNNYAMCSLLDMYIECIEHESSDRWENLPLKLYVGLERGESNGFIIASMLKWCSMLSNLDNGKLFHSLAKKLAVDSDPYVISALIDMYSKCGMPEAALRVFERVEDPGVATWSALISGLSWNGWFVEALTCFRKMQFNCIEANEFTFTSVILASKALGDLRKGRELHCKILKTCYESNVSVVNMLINLYSELSDHQQALKLCSLISDAEISWNLLIQACLKANDYEMIHKLLRRIQSCSGCIEPIAVCDIFNSCTSPVLLHMGMQAQAYMTKRGLLSHPTSGNSLIQMYSGCGQIAEADLAFELMPEKSSMSWASIISAKVEHGHPSEALALFNDMRRRNKLVDSSTLKSTLKACGQMGRVDEAHSLLMSMEVVYGVEPSEEHCSCVVEAFARAGMLEEVDNFINEVIPDKVGTTIWRTLLLCARVIGNMNIAKFALEKLLELDPSDCFANLLLEKVLLMSGKWKDASKAVVKTKTIGSNSSWIEVQNKIYEFVSKQNPTEEVSYKLAELEREMEELGYVADRNHLLHDAEEEEYNGAGLGHTEMKAIAFGLISLPSGMPIRVIKSVRMCGGCHSACKFMSTFVDRELVVKDTCTFHHFRKGKCSCQDSW
ncbi:pentatricopeptide repeat-containing protein At3g49170, chloroplastic-like [Durio zibethinus]|uniref:Pentatricopeptide repeat-containing protein At3g49170, chloroplastic-like n=1 Tax=Durio zibethinus TaxID=66656 RepID=A0A6P5ZTT9_DURZI|nr:pentatricopeptide repeat-containing protein At3g49170, chloroplastic-like [Durio zibethinus]